MHKMHPAGAFNYNQTIKIAEGGLTALGSNYSLLLYLNRKKTHFAFTKYKRLIKSEKNINNKIAKASRFVYSTPSALNTASSAEL